MSRTLFAAAAIGALTACGGTSTPTAQPAASSAPAEDRAGAPDARGAPDPWAAVMKPGTTFSFDNRIEGMDYDPIVVAARVTKVEELDAGRAIFLAWTENGEPMEGRDLPVVIVVGPGGVSFYADDDAFAERDPTATYPATAAAAGFPDGRYIERGGDGSLCYGIGPTDDAGDCEDTCYGQLCVHPTHGLTGGEGIWWPDYAGFERIDLR